ncbi:hypothetical protein BD310DRAFT_1034249 [Dichomitus squalens]|uniref:Uncharacterized protein n=1 Tax=Dichomitus squalens TaxID=114155 RepID=A0A4Q9QGG9_9APHY|nr:hypothetical protein BD310DRAFT_1034249 [Dichomitus squalens]
MDTSKDAESIDPSVPVPGLQPSDEPLATQEQQDATLQPKRSVLKTILRAIFFALVYVSFYSWMMATMAGVSYTVTHWVLRTIVSRWPSLDPSGSFQAIDPITAFAAVQASGYLVYLPRALVTMVPTVLVFHKSETAPRGRTIEPFKQWWARPTASIPSFVVRIFKSAFLFAVGPLGALLRPVGREPWLDVRHAMVVATVVCAWHATFQALVWLWQSRKPAIQLTDEKDVEVESMEQGREGVEEPADGGRKVTRAHIVLVTLATIPCLAFLMAYYNAYANVLAHWLLLRLTTSRWLAPLDAAKMFETGTFENTMWTAKLGAFAVATPYIVVAFLPTAFHLDEVTAKKNFEPIKEWWIRVTKPVPRVVMSALKPVLWISTGPIGVWLSRYWPSGKGPGLDACNATRVAVVAWVLITVWEKAVGSLASDKAKAVQAASLAQDQEEVQKEKDLIVQV